MTPPGLPKKVVLPVIAGIAILACFAACRSARFDGRDVAMGISPADVDPEAIDLPTAPRGDRLFAVFCAACHGREGRGDGPAASFCSVPPADFSRAEFKVRSTPTGSLPTDEDLVGTLRRGAGGDGAMPSFAFLSEADLRELIAVFKRFSPRWSREKIPDPVKLPASRLGSVERGSAIYRGWSCDACHGVSGRGDGPRSRELKNSRGSPEMPTDLTSPWTFKGGSDETSLVRSILTGFNGTTMPMMALSTGAEQEIWDLAAWLHSIQRAPEKRQRPSVDTTTLESYWRVPVPEQGGDLTATSCASCHPVQFADWSRSRHSKAMGPGVLAQLHDRPEEAPSCLLCHAPLAEQATDARLARQGVSCTVCHLRAHEAYGPPPTQKSLLRLVAQHEAPAPTHAREFFERSEFCAGCHQFREGEASRVHGKFLENTLEEWRASPSAREGKSCQSCHMPDRRHFFRGIHDPDTVRKGVGWKFVLDTPNGRVSAALTLTNSDTGHRFPTYAVPEVWMRIEVRDGSGRIIASTQRVIARQVSFAFGKWWESSDSRLAPGETARLEYDGSLPAEAVDVVGRVVVVPDAMYHDVFETLVRGARSEESRGHYQRAIDETGRSAYTLFRSQLPLRR